MSPPEPHLHAALVRATRRAQGLGDTITDDDALRRIAVVLLALHDEAGPTSPADATFSNATASTKREVCDG